MVSLRVLLLSTFLLSAAAIVDTDADAGKDGLGAMIEANIQAESVGDQQQEEVAHYEDEYEYKEEASSDESENAYSDDVEEEEEESSEESSEEETSPGLLQAAEVELHTVKRAGLPVLLEQIETVKKLVTDGVGTHEVGSAVSLDAPMSNALVESLTYQMMKIVIPAINAEHKSDLTKLALENKAVNDCDIDTNGLSSRKAISAGAKAQHSSCRNGQMSLATTQAKDQEEWTLFMELMVNPSEGGSGDAQSMKGWCPNNLKQPTTKPMAELALTQAQNWYTTNEAKARLLWSNVKKSRKALLDKRVECDGKQTAYETSVCMWRGNEVPKCGLYAKCYTKTTASVALLKTAIATRVVDRKQEFKAAKLIACYIGMLNITVQANRNFLLCSGMIIDDSSLNIPVTATPSPKCNTGCPQKQKPISCPHVPADVAGPQICSGAWLKKNYHTARWAIGVPANPVTGAAEIKPVSAAWCQPDACGVGTVVKVSATDTSGGVVQYFETAQGTRRCPQGQEITTATECAAAAKAKKTKTCDVTAKKSMVDVWAAGTGVAAGCSKNTCSNSRVGGLWFWDPMLPGASNANATWWPVNLCKRIVAASVIKGNKVDWSTGTNPTGCAKTGACTDKGLKVPFAVGHSKGKALSGKISLSVKMTRCPQTYVKGAVNYTGLVNSGKLWAVTTNTASPDSAPLIELGTRVKSNTAPSAVVSGAVVTDASVRICVNYQPWFSGCGNFGTWNAATSKWENAVCDNVAVTTYNDNKWHKFTVKWSAKSIGLMVDGVLKSKMALPACNAAQNLGNNWAGDWASKVKQEGMVFTQSDMHSGCKEVKDLSITTTSA